MPNDIVPQTDEQRLRSRQVIVAVACVLVMVVVMYFVLPAAYNSGKRSIMTPAEAAR